MIDHAERRNYLGCSELAAIFNLSPFSSAYEIYLEKKGNVEPKKGTKATQAGHDFETAVLDHADRDIFGVDAPALLRQTTMTSSGGILRATLDGMIPVGVIPVEAKTTGLTGPVYGDWGEANSDEVPDHVAIQVQGEIHCCGSDTPHGLVYALIAGRGVVRYEIPSDPDMQEMIEEETQRWWTDHIVGDKPPPLEALPPLSLAKRLKRVPNKVVKLSDKADELATKLEIAKERKKAVKDQIETIQTALLLMLDDAEEGLLPSGRRLTNFQTIAHYKAKEAHTITYRTLRIKK